MRYFLLLIVFFGAGCATRSGQGPVIPVGQLPAAEVPSQRMMIIYVPQTDEAAANWLKWFDANPSLKMVIAFSPRFASLAKDATLKTRLQALEKEGRLEIALQIPNAPILPLIAENPPYGYTDDIVQLIAQSKAGFYKTWNFLPRGFVLPYGAASSRLLSLLGRSGFAWIVAAVGQAPEGLLQYGSMSIWDGSSTGGLVRVWDERQTKEKLIDHWLKESASQKAVFLLPRDGGVHPAPLQMETLGQSTWNGSDWSIWTGATAKDVAWGALRTTRDALEKYKNSGQASVTRLDAALNEIYSAQNSNYFASAGNMTMSPALKEEREHEFQATLLGIYRLISQPAPDELFTAMDSDVSLSVIPSSTSIQAESLPEGREHIIIRDALGDEIVPGGGDLESLEIWTTTDSAHWVITLTKYAPALPLEIYIDLNHQVDAGTSVFLPGRPYFASAKDSWEYALAVNGQEATLYRTLSASSYGDAQKFPVVVEGRNLHIYLPQGVMRGRPSRWGYQMLIGAGTISDFIDPPEIPRKEFWQSLSTGNRHDFPFVRIKRN